MNQLPLFQPLAWSLPVTELTRYIRETLEGDEALQDLWVQGEITNLSTPSSGHMYFTIKDAGAALRCVMWRPQVRRQILRPEPGDAVEVHGHISVYEASGQYQLYADLIRPLGEGQLYQQFLELKDRLEAEGLFEPENKVPPPVWPHRLGIVTSPTGAALQDILNTLRRRFPLVQVILAPTLVQGAEAPAGIVQALDDLISHARPDVILLARGGGSIEDLWAFNDERVVRAVAAAPIPVITGVGHETDFTLADFVADLRAPTPTAAAELATPDQADLQAGLTELTLRLERSFETALNTQAVALENLHGRLRRNSPAARIRTDRQRLDVLAGRAARGVAFSFDLRRSQLAGVHQRLEALNPQAVLNRGYAIITTETGEVVSRVIQVASRDPIQVQVSDGTFTARVEETDERP